MARAGRPPKIATMSDLSESLVGEIDHAILSRADESATSIYTRFGLATRGIGKSSFDKYVGTLRREQKDRRYLESPPPPPDDVPSWDELDRRARVEALRALNEGSAKLYEIMLLSKAKRETDKLDLERMAEARADEKHAAWKLDYAARLKAAKDDADKRLDEVAKQKGIPESVAQGIKDLYGISVT